MNVLAQQFPLPVLDAATLRALLPFVVLALGATLALVASGLRQGQRAALLASLLTLAASVLAFLYAPDAGTVAGVLNLNAQTRAFALCLHLPAVMAMFTLGGARDGETLLPEAFPLVLFALAGMCLMVSSTHLLFQFIALETLSLAVYVLVSLRRQSRIAAEAGLKYFILGGLASALFLYGAALLFGATGSFDVAAIAQAPTSFLKTTGCVLVLAGLLFKVGAFPFHAWMPDVYQGASTPVTGFMAAAVKFTAFVALARFGHAALADADHGTFLHMFLGTCAAASMLYGNALAMLQRSFKRLLAFSSIAHTGYLLVGVAAASRLGGDASPLFAYLFFYVFAVMGALAVVQALFPEGDPSIDGLAGLGLTRPLYGACLSVFMFAMAGMPLTAGFIGKYLVLGAGVSAGLTPLVVLALLTSVLGMYYYLRVVVTLYMGTASEPAGSRPYAAAALAVVVLTSAGVTLWQGVRPTLAFFQLHGLLQ